jgi:hypothetical protein
MQSPVATGAANESIDPSAHKERGPQDDKVNEHVRAISSGAISRGADTPVRLPAAAKSPPHSGLSFRAK